MDIVNNDAYEIALGELKIKYTIELVTNPKISTTQPFLKKLNVLLRILSNVNIRTVIDEVNRSEGNTIEIYTREGV